MGKRARAHEENVFGTITIYSLGRRRVRTNKSWQTMGVAARDGDDEPPRDNTTHGFYYILFPLVVDRSLLNSLYPNTVLKKYRYTT